MASCNSTPKIDAPSFSGEKDDCDFKAFWMAFSNCAEINKWDQLTKLRILKAKLTKSAARFMMHLPIDVQGDISEIHQSFVERYHPKSKSTAGNVSSAILGSETA